MLQHVQGQVHLGQVVKGGEPGREQEEGNPQGLGRPERLTYGWHPLKADADSPLLVKSAGTPTARMARNAPSHIEIYRENRLHIDISWPLG